jgi:hypothetical protein
METTSPDHHLTKISNWPELLIIAGGLLMALLWPLFTALHGPTSFNQDNHFLGQDPLFWGMLMSAPASLMISVGLIARYPLLARVEPKAKVGFVLLLVGLVISATVDLITISLGPPFMVPLMAIGCLLLGTSHRKKDLLPKTSWRILLFLAILMTLAVLSFLIPLEVLDRYDGYRLYGILTNLLFGLGWVVFGLSLWRDNRKKEKSI